MEGYIFTTEQLALAKIAEINLGEGIPKKNSITQSYCECYPCVGGYYIEHDSITEKYCTNKQTIIL